MCYPVSDSDKIFTARRHISAEYVVVGCLSVCLSVRLSARHKSEFYQNG